MSLRPLAVLALAGMIAGCTGSREADRPPDDQFGHRFERNAAPDSRPTISIAAADDGMYFYYPVFVDSVHIRQGAFEPDIAPEMQRVAVEVLAKGVFPDDCSDLSDVEQRRYGHIIEVDLIMRKRQDSVCMRVRRPFRFYFVLDGSFRPGHYTLKLNNTTYPFEVRAGRR